MAFSIFEFDGIPPINKRLPVDIMSTPHDLGGEQHTGQLIDSQIPAFIMRISQHQNDPHTMIIDGRDVSADGIKLDTIETGAEVNNLTDTQALSLTSGTHSNWHNHDDFYYRKSELFSPNESQVNWLNLVNVPQYFTPAEHTHDDRYFTENEIETNYYNKVLIDTNIYTKVNLQTSGQSQVNWGNITNVPDFSLSSHSHDDRYFTENEIETNYYSKNQLDAGQLDSRYYTENEINTFYYSKNQLDAGQLDNRYYTENEVNTLISAASYGIAGSVETFTDLPVVTDEGIIYIVKQTVGVNEEGFYRWNGSAWIFLANNTGTSVHNQTIGLNDGDYKHLTELQFISLTGGNSTLLHNHDEKYYSKINLQTSGQSQVNWSNITNVPDFSLSNHSHDDRYFTENETTTLLNGKSDLVHNHDDLYYRKLEITSNYYSKNQLDTGQLDSRYYTENEINTLLNNKASLIHNHDDIYYRKEAVDALISQCSIIGHNHNDLYYTEAEIDNFMESKANAVHTHDDRYFTENELGSMSGISGASLVGVSLIGGMTSTNVQTALQELKNQITNFQGGSLNQSYSIGSSITITQNYGPVKINASQSTKAPLELTSLTAAPAEGLTSGQVAIINNELYIYNMAKSKWLTPTKILLFGRMGSADGHILYSAGGVAAGNSGYKMAKNGTIVSMTIESSNSQSKNTSVLINGESIYTILSSPFVDNNININFNAGDYISVYVDSYGPSISNPVVVLEIAWRA